MFVDIFYILVEFSIFLNTQMNTINTIADIQSKITFEIDLFSKNTSVEDFNSALQENPTRKDETTDDGNLSLLTCVVTWNDVDKLKQLVSLGCVVDENLAAEKCQDHKIKVKISFSLLLSIFHLLCILLFFISPFFFLKFCLFLTFRLTFYRVFSLR